MAIGSHGTGRGGTVGDDRTGRSAELGKALSFSSLFGTAGVETDPVKTETNYTVTLNSPISTDYGARSVGSQSRPFSLAF